VIGAPLSDDLQKGSKESAMPPNNFNETSNIRSAFQGWPLCDASRMGVKPITENIKRCMQL